MRRSRGKELGTVIPRLLYKRVKRGRGTMSGTSDGWTVMVPGL